MRALPLAVLVLAGCLKQVPLLRPCTEPPEDPAPLRVHAEVNFGENVRWAPSYAYAPNCNEDSLARVLRRVDETLPAQVKVKAAGSRHAFNPAAATDGVAIYPERDAFLEVVGPNLVRVGAGSTLRALNETLWAMGKALPVLGGYDGQTLAGATSTGTHGSQLTSGPLADALIRQVDLVTAAGTKVRLEPEHGALTDPLVFAREHPDATLLQRDDAFNAAKLSLGTLGVVHSYVLEVVDRFWLEEVRTRTTLARVKQVLADGGIYSVLEHAGSSPEGPRFDPKHPAPAHHLELLWNVHTGTVVVTTRQPFEESKVSALCAGERARPGAWLTDTWGRQLAAVNEVLERLLPQTIPSLVEAALTSLLEARFVGRSFEVYTVGQGLNAMPFLLGSFSVPLEHDAYLDALEVIEAVAADLARRGHFQPGPVALRFVRGVKGALLGRQNDSCEFEFIFSGTDPRSRAEAELLMDAYDRALHARFGGAVSLHFGQLYPSEAATFHRTAEAHPGLARFNEVRRALDPKGRFLNPFQARLLVGR